MWMDGDGLTNDCLTFVAILLQFIYDFRVWEMEGMAVNLAYLEVSILYIFAKSDKTAW